MGARGNVPFRIKYPKLLLLVLSYVIAFFMFAGRSYASLHDTLVFLGYFGTFLAGFLYVYAFTAAPATVILLILAKEQNLLLEGFIAGLGALLGDFTIFYFVRYSLSGEIQKLLKEKIVKSVQKKVPSPIQKCLLASLASFFHCLSASNRNRHYIISFNKENNTRKIFDYRICPTHHSDLHNPTNW
jgi:uncharacterized membrane protein YdjX (TVP38/TMEM64 family)